MPHSAMKEVDLDEPSKTGKSQVTLLYFLLIFLKDILLAHFQSLFGKSNRDLSLENEVKIYYIKEDM